MCTLEEKARSLCVCNMHPAYHRKGSRSNSTNSFARAENQDTLSEEELLVCKP